LPLSLAKVPVLQYLSDTYGFKAPFDHENCDFFVFFVCFTNTEREKNVTCVFGAWPVSESEKDVERRETKKRAQKSLKEEFLLCSTRYFPSL